MNPEKIDRLLKQCDPVIDSGHSDTIVGESQSNWAELAARRVVVRRRARNCLAATGLVLVVGGLAVSGRWNVATTESNYIAESSSGIENAGQLPELTPATTAEDGARDGGQRTPSKARAQAMASNLKRKSDPGRVTPSRQGRINPPVRTRQTVDPANGSATKVREFARFIDHAGRKQSDDWKRACAYLASQTYATQREAIELVTQLTDPERRSRASKLVCQAAGDSHRKILMHWLSVSSMRSMAWSHLLETATLGQSVQLIEFATSPRERRELCQSIAMSAESESVQVLLDLARDPSWRSAIRRSAGQLNSNQIQSLVMLMRERNRYQRTAAAFVLASIPGEQVDRGVASMILNGRFRQPAYLVLMSRDTPQSRAFLAAAESSPELNPALFSARMHFANMEETLHQWIAESNGANNDSSDTSLRFMSETSGNDRCASLLDARREVS